MSYAPQVTLRWTLNVLVRFCRSLGRACFRSSRAKPTLSPPPIPIPIVLVPGNMGSGAKTASQLRAQGVNAVDAKLGPVSSCHDRACELFYALKVVASTMVENTVLPMTTIASVGWFRRKEHGILRGVKHRL